MKFMGSKRWMLSNGLGLLISRELQSASRFVDLFAGSGAVSAHVAASFRIKVIAHDLQLFSVILTRSVIERCGAVEHSRIWDAWLLRASRLRSGILMPAWAGQLGAAQVRKQRAWCTSQPLPVTKAYGGHYFSAEQALWFDALRQSIPRREPAHSLALAALIRSASECAAAPGHTAQPFQPTTTALPFVQIAWRKNVAVAAHKALEDIAMRGAQLLGAASVADANAAAHCVNKGDVVFVDPPYSGVHYSRFYHVLETIARGNCGVVSGAGRYPARASRPQSRYSMKTTAAGALQELFATLADRDARAIVTFPQRACSNGLSGELVTELAAERFWVERHWVKSKFSTLGGNNSQRQAREAARELILVLRPKAIRLVPVK